MRTEDKKYIDNLKKEIIKKLDKHNCKATVGLHLSREIIIIDMTITPKKHSPLMRAKYTYHDCFAMPADYSYGVATVHASIIVNQMFDTMKEFI